MEKLTKAEIAGLQALAQECHEELVKGIPPAVISPICNECRKRGEGAECSRYPNGIPKAILFRKMDCEAFQEK